MSAAAPPGAIAAAEWDGVAADALARTLGLPRVVAFLEVGSTLDVAHALAADGAEAGTLVLSEVQTAGRGRQGRQWRSAEGQGIWLTMIERPRDVEALAVLSLRLGLALAGSLEPFAGERVRVKWPNDLHTSAGKLAGILVEARWREQRPEWVALGVGINVVPPAELAAAGLRPGTSRAAVLGAIVPAMRRAASCAGALTGAELSAWAERDLAAGRRCREPREGVVRGIDPRGALLVQTAGGIEPVHSGSLVFMDSVEGTC